MLNSRSSATQQQSWGSSAGGPGFGRGMGLGCPYGALPCPFLDKLVPCGAEVEKVEHLVGRVLYAGVQVGVGSTVGSGCLGSSDLGAVGSSLWEAAWDEPLGSKKCLFLCRAHEMQPVCSPRDPLVLP